jgi:ADP-ribose pyrophosphatase
MKGEVKTLKSSILFRGKILNLRVDEILLPSGRETTREIVEYKGAVTLVPVFNDGGILFVKQYRYVVGDELLELPAGKLEEGEEPEETARRELLEETGYFPKKLKKLASFYVHQVIQPN